jgi:succinate dehydrogenase/fumarate reductase-like Fe-S protein
MTTPVENGPEMPREQDRVNIYIMGKKYRVPDSLTIMKAFEYAGYKLIRGCGCRAGFCGACATVYRIGKEHELKVGLACQTKVEDDMYLTQIPFFPAHEVEYSLAEIEPTGDQLLDLFPEITKCLGCNSCTNVCPQDLNVMKYISHAIRGEIKEAADESFDCIMCGLCASRCPANIVQYKVGLVARRIYGKYLAPKADHLDKMLDDLAQDKYITETKELMQMSVDDLKERYNNREIEV